MKFLFYFLSLFCLFSCNTKLKVDNSLSTKQLNYIPYYLTVDKAKKLYKRNEFAKSYKLLDSLFEFYKPINNLYTDELELYCELATKYKKKKKIQQVIEIMVFDYGFNIANYEDEKWIQIKEFAEIPQIKLIQEFKDYKQNLNIELRDSIITIFKKEQEIRSLTKSRKSIDSVDRIYEPYIVKTIKKLGFPNYKTIGGNTLNDPMNPAYMSVLLKHISIEGILEIQPILFEELKKGNLHPENYASMLDVRKIIAKEETPFEYYGTISNYKPKDTLATNNARELIGLSRINF